MKNFSLPLVCLLFLGASPAVSFDGPFGLTQRESLAALNLEPNVSSPGSFQAVDAFPSLTFSSPVFTAGVPGEDRLVVVEQSGAVKAFQNDRGTAQARVILDLSDRVLFDNGEQGLLGLAFDPEFQRNRFIYVHYSADSPRRSVIARFTWDVTLDLADPATQEILLEVEQPFANHNAGMLAFGPDDFLYIALGDGGSGGDPQNNAQNPSNFLGALLRVDPRPEDLNQPYAIPAGNPFVEQTGFRPEIWAYGFRNPYRFSFDRQLGTLWLADVGQNTVEEIDIVDRAGNYGWRVFEGRQPFNREGNELPDSAFIPPVFQYEQPPGQAIIGGYVYRGNRLMSLTGAYLYGDFVSGRIWALAHDGDAVISNTEIANVNMLTSFGEDNQGELLMVSRAGSIFRLEESSATEIPAIPTLLSETGVFTDLVALEAAAGFIEYAVNTPSWSDGATTRRWLGVPDGGAVAFDPAESWRFPVDTAIVEHFEIELIEGNAATRRRLETRILNKTSVGWSGFTYRWNSAGTEATLVADTQTETLTIQSGSGARDQLYEYPGPGACVSCHTAVAGSVLGLRTSQINRDFDYPAATDNQLRSLNNIQLFDRDIGSEFQYAQFPAIDNQNQLIETRARAYLAANCSYCHQPGGPTPAAVDLRFSTPKEEMRAIGEPPRSGDLGISGARIIDPGSKETSMLWQRMRRLDIQRMPPLSSHAVDVQAVELIGQWIDNLNGGEGVLSAAILPGSRSVPKGETATAFATIINAGPIAANGCIVQSAAPTGAAYEFQTTDPVTNGLTGLPDSRIDIPASSSRTFLLALTPDTTFGPKVIQFVFDCDNTSPAAISTGVNTFSLSSNATPTPDIIGLTTTTDLQVNLGETALFAVATFNAGAAGAITASLDTGNQVLPLNLLICVTDTNGACLDPPAATASLAVASGARPAFAVFATPADSIARNAATNRIFVRFMDGSGVLRGSTSTAVRTQ